MYLLKTLCVALSLTAVAVAEPAPAPALAGQNQYLPPDNGYRYQPPKVPFPTPTYRPPTQPTYRPPPTTTHTSGGTILPVYRTTTLPPVTYAPPVTVPPTYRPPVTQRPYTPPVEHHDHHHHEPGMPFDFAYAVKDDLHGADYAHKANSNGDVVEGEYRIALPDGRVQLVRYTADWATGFHAHVTYEGQASYPAPAPRAYGPPATQQQTPYQ